MRKRIFINTVITAVFICLAACENPIMETWWEGSKKTDNGIVLNSNSNNNTGNNGNNTGSNGNNTGNNGNNTGNNGNNTGNNGNNGNNVNNNNLYSNIVTITGLSVKNKDYDGTTSVTITGTPVLNGVIKGDDLKLKIGTVAFADANAGTNKTIVFNGWSLGGTDVYNYTLQTPNLTANINKVDPYVGWPYSLGGVLGKTLQGTKLPSNGISSESGTFTWTNPGTLLNSLGKQKYNMTFTPDDTLNYNIVTSDVEVIVIAVKMVKIPKGIFIMGGPSSEPGWKQSEAPQHQVELSSFYMSECLITQEEYEAVMGKNPSTFKSAIPGESETPGKRPVETVSWFDILVFCNKLSMMEGLTPAYRIPAFNNSTDPADWGALPTIINDPVILAAWYTVEMIPGSNGYRLPTEAQWEYACRAGTTTLNYIGDTLTDDLGWHRFNSSNTHKVGIKPANPWGLYDMMGNVSEWCWDWYDSYTGNMEIDPVGPSSSPTNTRIRRSDFFRGDEYSLRSANRSYNLCYQTGWGVGFRLVRPDVP